MPCLNLTYKESFIDILAGGEFCSLMDGYNKLRMQSFWFGETYALGLFLCLIK